VKSITQPAFIEFSGNLMPLTGKPTLQQQA